MNTEEKLTILKGFLKDLDALTLAEAQHPPKLTLDQISSSALPEIDLVGSLMSHHDDIMAGLEATYSAVSPVLNELSGLQSHKQNVNLLLDSMTAIQEVKRLSYGLGSSTAQICRNLAIYFQIKDKVFYCDKQVEAVQAQIKKVESQFKQILQGELRKVNSDNVTELAKALNLIARNSSEASTGNSNDQLANFYVELLRKELLKYEDDLLKIPIVGNTTSNSYLFFQICKEIMKSVVSVVSTYRGNILKIGGEESLHVVIVRILGFVMDGLILEVLVRERKYFEMDNMDAKKVAKESAKFQDYFREFSAISNQIQRLRAHIAQELPSSYPQHRSYISDIDMAVNSSRVIAINSEATEGLKNHTRSQFNKLLKKSPLITALWQFDYEFLERVSQSCSKSGGKVYECPEAHDFLIETYTIFAQAIQKSLESLNVLVISSIISFANNNLIQEDSFHGFNELFDRAMSRFPSAETKYCTGIVVIINSIVMMPNALLNGMGGIVIPGQLNQFKTRLESQLKQLIQVCEFKVKSTINSYVSSIVSTEWFSNELRADFKKLLERWKGMAPEANEIFLNRASIVHAQQIMSEQFNAKKSSKLLTQMGIINFEKEVRSIISFYEGRGCSILQNFKKVFAYIEILLAENEEAVGKLLRNFNIEDPQEIAVINSLRNMKAG